MKSHFSRRSPSRRACAGIVSLFGLLGVLAGCDTTPAGIQSESISDRPFDGVSLTVSCADVRLAGILAPMVKVWGARTGANVLMAGGPEAAGELGDIAVVSSAQLGAMAEAGDLHPVPGSLKEPGHPYQWSAVLPAFRGEAYAGWGSQLYGLPLAAPGHVLIYRTDHLTDAQAKAAFQSSRGRPLVVPASWQEFAEVAVFFTRHDRRPALHSFPTEAERLVGLFSRVASCFDRPAQTEGGAAGTAPVEAERLAFQFRLRDGQPRIDTRAFVEAAHWFAALKTQKCLSEDATDPITAIREGKAVMALVALEDLARLRQDRKSVKGCGIAPLPGSKFYFDPETGTELPSPGNSVPYHDGGWLGVVRTSCKHPAAAFALLAELGGPTRSLEVIAAGGYGPTRDTHLDRDRLTAWYGYGFDDEQSKALQDALRTNAGKAVRNPTFGVRGPDHDKLTAALGEELKRIVEGTVQPGEGLSRAADAWKDIGAATPADQLRSWRRRAVGLN